MVLVIGNVAIEGAPALVNLFPAGAASILTASDLYHSFKCSVSVSGFPSSKLVIGNKEITPSEISGIITLVPCFLPMEFYYVDPEDQDYVCDETNAFFQYLLNEWRCPKCNPPDTKMFVGWNVHKLEWLKTAIRLNIPLLPFQFKNGYAVHGDHPLKQKPDKCTVIFSEVTASSLPEEVRQHARSLADALSLSYLDCYFVQDDNEKYLLSYINTIPDISIPANREKIADHFLSALT